MKIKTILMVTLLAVCISTGVMAKGGKTNAPLESLDTWMGVYYDNAKIGYMHTTISKDTFEGKDVLKREDKLSLKGCFSGKVDQIEATRILIVDTRYNPLYESLSAGSSNSPKPDDRSGNIEMRHGKKDVILKMKSDKEGDKGFLTIPRDEEDKERSRLSSQYDLGAMKLVVGDKVRMSHIYFFNIAVEKEQFKLSIEGNPTVLSVVQNEKLQLDGHDYDTLMVSELTEKDKADETRRWHLATGEVLKMEVPADHITFIREPREKAISIPAFSGPDLSELVK